MIAVCVTFRIRKGRMEDFMAAMCKQARDSIEKEDRCRRFDVCTDGDGGDTVFLYELYEDRGAFDAHLGSEHFRSFDAKVRDWVEDKSVQVHGGVFVA